MSRNAVQFQKGLSMTGFVRRYGTEGQCHDALVAMRWPDGAESGIVRVALLAQPHCKSAYPRL